MAKLDPRSIAAAQAALMLNAKKLRLDLEDDASPGTLFFHMLVSLIEWCEAQSPKVDFDAAVDIVRQHFAEVGGR